MNTHLSFSKLAQLFFALTALTSIGVHAQQTATDPAFTRVQNLKHGINASIWFAQHPQDYSVERLRTFTTADDISLIAKLGFDHVRLSVDADPITDWQRGRDNGVAFMTELDRVVKTIVDNHLAVIVDMHPESKYKAPLKQGTASVQQFTSLWRALARHYAGTDPDHVYFEIMNEPEQDDPYRWQGIEATVAAAIREAAPRHTIIVAGAHWSGLEDLLVLQPIALDNVIYTFHDYEPFPFTHQGATWTSPEVQPLRAIPYPSSPEEIAPKLQQEPDLASQFWLKPIRPRPLGRRPHRKHPRVRRQMEQAPQRPHLLRRIRRPPRLRPAKDARPMAPRHARCFREEQHRLGDVGLPNQLRHCHQKRRNHHA